MVQCKTFDGWPLIPRLFVAERVTSAAHSDRENLMFRLWTLKLAGASALALAVTAANSAASVTKTGQNTPQPEIQSGTVPTIEIDDLHCRDLDRIGGLTR